MTLVKLYTLRLSVYETNYFSQFYVSIIYRVQNGCNYVICTANRSSVSIHVTNCWSRPGTTLQNFPLI